jgi:hypothetical protein
MTSLSGPESGVVWLCLLRVALKSGNISKLSVSNPFFIAWFSFLVFVFEVDLLHVTASVHFWLRESRSVVE